MKVKAKKRFEYITDNTVNRKRKEGEIFEVDESRAKLLLDHNLIEIVREVEIETPIEEVKEETKPKKRGRKPKK